MKMFGNGNETYNFTFQFQFGLENGGLGYMYVFSKTTTALLSCTTPTCTSNEPQESFHNKYSYKICINFIHFPSSSFLFRAHSELVLHTRTQHPEQKENGSDEDDEKK